MIVSPVECEVVLDTPMSPLARACPDGESGVFRSEMEERSGKRAMIDHSLERREEWLKAFRSDGHTSQAIIGNCALEVACQAVLTSSQARRMRQGQQNADTEHSGFFHSEPAASLDSR